MPTNVQIELDNIVKILKEDKIVKSIYLFGSYAYGTLNKESDLDIAVNGIFKIRKFRFTGFSFVCRVYELW